MWWYGTVTSPSSPSPSQHSCSVPSVMVDSLVPSLSVFSTVGNTNSGFFPNAVAAVSCNEGTRLAKERKKISEYCRKPVKTPATHSTVQHNIIVHSSPPFSYPQTKTTLKYPPKTKRKKKYVCTVQYSVLCVRAPSLPRTTTTTPQTNGRLPLPSPISIYNPPCMSQPFPPRAKLSSPLTPPNQCIQSQACHRGGCG